MFYHDVFELKYYLKYILEIQTSEKSSEKSEHFKNQRTCFNIFRFLGLLGPFSFQKWVRKLHKAFQIDNAISILSYVKLTSQMYIFIHHQKYQKYFYLQSRNLQRPISKLVEDSVGYIICLPKISLTMGCSKETILKKGSSRSREEQPFFMASVIPAGFHPFATISFSAFDVKWLYNSISQLA